MNLWRNLNNCGVKRGPRAALLFALLALGLFAPLPPARADDPPPFFLHDGDTVVFYGDSITEQQEYTRDIETFVLARFPQWHVKFINAGWSGDRVSGGTGGPVDTRLRRDVLPYHPSVVTVLLGTNDGGYKPFSQAAYDAYARGMTRLVDTLQQDLPAARLTLLTPPYYDENTRVAKTRRLSGYNDVLVKYGDLVKTLAAQRGLPVVDLNAPLREATRTGRRVDLRFTLVPDGIHPDEAGHAILAAAILQAWHAPQAATTLTLDPAGPTAEALPLPWPLPDKARAAFVVSPLPGPLDVFRARLSGPAEGLPGDRYDLDIAGRPVTRLKRRDLEAGVNLNHLPDLPENRQAARVLKIVQDRLDAWRYLWNGGPNAVARRDDVPTAPETAALVALDGWLDTQRDQAREAAQPQAQTFTLRPAPQEASSKIRR